AKEEESDRVSTLIPTVISVISAGVEQASKDAENYEYKYAYKNHKTIEGAAKKVSQKIKICAKRFGAICTAVSAALTLWNIYDDKMKCKPTNLHDWMDLAVGLIVLGALTAVFFGLVAAPAIAGIILFGTVYSIYTIFRDVIHY